MSEGRNVEIQNIDSIGETQRNQTFSKLARVIEGFRRFSRKSDRLFRLLFSSAFVHISFKKFIEDFDLEEAIKEAPGPLLEVGGPTDYEHYLVDIKNSERRMYVSNLMPGNPIYDTNNLNKGPVGYIGKIDLQTDAANLAIKDQSLGVLFASCLPQNVREGLIKEASRVLKLGGLFIASRLSEKNIFHAKRVGLELVEQIEYRARMANENRFDGVFRKRQN